MEPREIDALVQTALNHDGFVSYKNNPDGTKSPYELNISYFDALSNPSAAESEDTQAARFLAAHSIMLAMRGLPGIYFHSSMDHAETEGLRRKAAFPAESIGKKLDLAELETALDDPNNLRIAFLLAFANCSGSFLPSGF